MKYLLKCFAEVFFEVFFEVTNKVCPIISFLNHDYKLLVTLLRLLRIVLSAPLNLYLIYWAHPWGHVPGHMCAHFFTYLGPVGGRRPHRNHMEPNPTSCPFVKHIIKIVFGLNTVSCCFH